ncbi:MAG: aminotransferase class I/II-fold pyridoxal phosphate-dependent enzyme [Myxococcales bacterium]|nr:aminotransferase class I/II-fold pyridoxal phosphate-dependent enzyme [Myxococcales bacterium]
MSGSSRFERLKNLPPYVLARVDELKTRLRAEGREIYDFGLGNPDGDSPKAVVARLQAELGRTGFQRYMPSKGLPEVRQAICTWYQRRYGQTFNPDTEAVITIGSKEGIGHLLLAIVAPGDCVLSPDPGYPIHRFGVLIAGGEPVPVRVAPGLDHYAEIEAALARAPRKPKGLIVNFPHNPTTAVADLDFYRRVVALAKRESLWVISDLAYADLTFEGRQTPSIFEVEGSRDVAIEFFTVSKSYNMPGWRVGFAVGNPELVGSVTTMKGYMDYGIFAPNQLAAATALLDCEEDVARIRALYRHRSEVLVRGLTAAGWPASAPQATMFVWARIPDRFAPEGAVAFAARLLEEAGVAVAPGVGFGPGGEGHVRFSLIESDERVEAACQAIGRFLAKV